MKSCFEKTDPAFFWLKRVLPGDSMKLKTPGNLCSAGGFFHAGATPLDSPHEKTGKLARSYTENSSVFISAGSGTSSGSLACSGSGISSWKKLDAV